MQKKASSIVEALGMDLTTAIRLYLTQLVSHRGIPFSIKKIIEKLAKQEPISEKHKDHALIGNYSGYRELHITWKPDFLLLYKISENELILQRLRKSMWRRLWTGQTHINI